MFLLGISGQGAKVLATGRWLNSRPGGWSWLHGGDESISTCRDTGPEGKGQESTLLSCLPGDPTAWKCHFLYSL